MKRHDIFGITDDRASELAAQLCEYNLGYGPTDLLVMGYNAIKEIAHTQRERDYMMFTLGALCEHYYPLIED